jgi:hypothetical protein
MSVLAGNTGLHEQASPRRAIGARMVLALIPVIWALNLLDLLFTLLAYQMGDFDELNPLASALGWHNQIPLKLGALIYFSAVCIAVRHRRLTQLGCYVVTGVYTVLAVIWVSMFGFLLSPHFFQMLLRNF